MPMLSELTVNGFQYGLVVEGAIFEVKDSSFKDCYVGLDLRDLPSERDHDPLLGTFSEDLSYGTVEGVDFIWDELEKPLGRVGLMLGGGLYTLKRLSWKGYGSQDDMGAGISRRNRPNDRPMHPETLIEDVRCIDVPNCFSYTESTSRMFYSLPRKGQVHTGWTFLFKEKPDDQPPQRLVESTSWLNFYHKSSQLASDTRYPYGEPSCEKMQRHWLLSRCNGLKVISVTLTLEDTAGENQVSGCTPWGRV
jgi:hypothetical protein